MKRVGLFAMLLSLGIAGAFAASWTGYISDAKCGAKGDQAKHANCAAKCVKGGSEAVFVADGKIYKISDQSKVTDHAGHHVTITGKMTGDTIDVEDVKMVEH